MAEVSNGSVATLPNSIHPLPAGSMCDMHPDRAAVARIQGETDSFGCEYNDMCQSCLDAHRAYIKSPEARTGVCDWCKKHKTTLRNRRDLEEGMAGPVYRVCVECVTKEETSWVEELNSSLDRYGDYGDHGGYDD